MTNEEAIKWLCVERQLIIREWLESFNTESATECFTAIQQLKEKIYAENNK